MKSESNEDSLNALALMAQIRIGISMYVFRYEEFPLDSSH